MAFITKTPSGTFSVGYRCEGKSHKRTFKDKASARRFKEFIELNPERRSSRLTLTDLLLMYRDSETMKKRGIKQESLRLESLARRDFAQLRLDKITRQTMQRFADMRAQEINPQTGEQISSATLIREFATLSAVFHWAIDRGFMLDSPVRGVHLPKAPEHRERVATAEDIERLLTVSGWDMKTPPENSSQLVIAAFLFSCRTGMRAGEILKIEEAWIEDKVIHLPASATKTNTKRDVAIGKDAMKILNLVRQARGAELFSMRDNTRDELFRRMRERAGLGIVRDSKGNVIREALHFHDGRATFATWAASPDPRTGAPRLDVMALARQTGHRDLKMLMRYYRQTAQEIAERL